MGEHTIAQCVTELERLFTRVDSKPHSERSTSDYIPIYIYLYGWLLQRNDSIVRVGKLVSMIGKDFDREIFFQIKTDVRDYLKLKSDPKGEVNPATVLQLEDTMMKAVPQVFNKIEYGYRIEENIPNVSNVQGSQLLEYFFQLSSPKRGATLTDLICDGLTSSFPGIEISDIQERKSGSPDVKLVSDSLGIWKFFLAIYPSGSAIPLSNLMEIMNELNTLRTNFNFKEKMAITDLRYEIPVIYPILFLTSAVNGEPTAEFLNKMRGVYYGWSHSTLRMFHLFEHSASTNKALASKCLIEIFNGQHLGLAFSSTVAADNLKNLAKSGAYLLPYWKTEKGLQFGLTNTERGESLALLRDKSIHRESTWRVIQHAEEPEREKFYDSYFMCQIINRDKYEQLKGSEADSLQWLSADEIGERLSKSENTIVQRISLTGL